MKHFLYLFLSTSLVALEESFGLDLQKKIIQIHMVNTSQKEFKGKYKFLVIADYAVKYKDEDQITINPGHRLSLRLLGYKGLINKLKLESSNVIRIYLLHDDHYALCISDITKSSVSEFFINTMNIETALTYPEMHYKNSYGLPRLSSCVIM